MKDRERQDGMMAATTADLHDAHPDIVRVVDLQFRAFGKRRRFWGACVPIRTYESHLPVLEALRQDGRGRVLVVDGGGSLRIGVLGDRLAQIGVENGWAGIIINGAARDTVAVDGMEIGLRAMGTTARRSLATQPAGGPGPVGFGGVTFGAGDWVYVDEDAVIVSETRIDPATVEPPAGRGY